MKNISLKQYTTLPDTLLYDVILEHLNPKNSFAEKSMNTNLMPYANVKYCIRLLPKIDSWQGICQLFTICFDVTEDEFWNAPITDYYPLSSIISHPNTNLKNLKKQWTLYAFFSLWPKTTTSFTITVKKPH